MLFEIIRSPSSYNNNKEVNTKKDIYERRNSMRMANGSFQERVAKRQHRVSLNAHENQNSGFIAWLELREEVKIT